MEALACHIVPFIVLEVQRQWLREGHLVTVGMEEDKLDDSANRAEQGVSRSTKANHLTVHTILLSGEGEGDKGGVDEIDDGAQVQEQPALSQKELDVL